MLYSILSFTGLLFLSYSQTCEYSSTDLYNKKTGVTQFDRSGDQQYVVYDFAQVSGIRGEYYLPYIFTDEDGETSCHNNLFSSSVTIAFSCSTGYDDDSETSDTIVYARTYASSDCSGTATSTVWWQKGYSPYFDETGAVTTSSDCDSTTSCEAMNYTRQAVTQYSGNRFDFSCEGDVEYTQATLCVFSSDCDGNQCSTVNAALGASCIATPNSTYANLLVSCNKKEAYLFTYIDISEFSSGNAWNDYTVDRTCTDDGTTGYVCNAIPVGKECADAFTTSFSGADVTVTGYMSYCSAPFSASSNLTYSLTFLLISALVIIFIGY